MTLWQNQVKYCHWKHLQGDNPAFFKRSEARAHGAWGQRDMFRFSVVRVQSYFPPGKSHPQGFPGGSMVKNLPANAGDTSSIPGLGRSRMPRGTSARAPWLLSLCSRAQEPQLLKPKHPRACTPQQDKQLQCEARACLKEA